MVMTTRSNIRLDDPTPKTKSANKRRSASASSTQSPGQGSPQVGAFGAMAPAKASGAGTRRGK